MKGRIISLIMALTSVMLTTAPFNAAADDMITVTLDSKELQFDEPPIIKNDSTLVPMRGIFEALGYEVSWNGDTKVASATNGYNSIAFAEGSSFICSSSGGYTLDVAPVNVNGCIMVPLRMISECAGCTVDWDEASRTVALHSGKVKPKELETTENTFTFNGEAMTEAERYEYFRTSIFPYQQIKYRIDTEISEIVAETSHAYIDVDNDGRNELVIYSVDTEDGASGYISAWKMSDNNTIVSLFTDVYNASASPYADWFSAFISLNGKNCLDLQHYSCFKGSIYWSNEVYEFKDGKWLSISNSKLHYCTADYFGWCSDMGFDSTPDGCGPYVVMNGAELGLSAIMDTDLICPGSVIDGYIGWGGLRSAQENIKDDIIGPVADDVKYGDYLGAIQKADELLADELLPAELRTDVQALRQKAQDRYNAYLNGTLHFYNASEEIKQIEWDLKYAPERALENCRNTLAWHELSPADIVLLERYMAKAEFRD